MIVHYPQHYGYREERKGLTRIARRLDDRDVKVGIERSINHPGKKDAHRWCRGKIGIEHQTEWVKWFDASWRAISWWKQICTVCGKKVRIEERPTGRSE